MNRRNFFTRLAGAIGAIAGWPFAAKADKWKPNPYLTADQKQRFIRSLRGGNRTGMSLPFTGHVLMVDGSTMHLKDGRIIKVT